MLPLLRAEAAPVVQGAIQSGPAPTALQKEQLAVTEYIAKRYRVSEAAVRNYVATAYRAGAQYSLDPLLILAVMAVESSYNPVAESGVGAKGLMQILPSTAQFIAHRSGGTRFELRDLANPQINISYGSWYLRYLLDRYDGNEVAAVAAYNAGHERVDDWGGSGLEVADIRFAETEQYTRDVMDKRGEYRDKYRAELGL